MAEPWLRETLTEVEPVLRAALHALELAGEDVERWAAQLSDAEMFQRPAGLPPVAFHLRHMVRSLDRLLTYVEGRQLGEEQLRALAWEMDEIGTASEVLSEFREGVVLAMERIRAIAPESFSEARGVGRKMLPTTVAGLLVHCAEHTQRHSGQMVTTVKVIRD
jgi:hypothetical protein